MIRREIPKTNSEYHCRRLPENRDGQTNRTAPEVKDPQLKQVGLSLIPEVTWKRELIPPKSQWKRELTDLRHSLSCQDHHTFLLKKKSFFHSLLQLMNRLKDT